MQIDQLFELVYILIDKKQTTAAEMAKRFGVSTRTIYRWLDALSVSGVPVYSLKGRGGGIAISEKYALDKTVLSEDERLAILSSVKALNSLSGSSCRNEGSAESAIKKLSHLVTSDSDWLEVDFAPWSPEGSSVRQVFGTLRDCILKKRQVVFDYYSGDGSAERRTVHPWKLIYKGQAWYMQGWCTLRKAERFFKLSRMRNVEMTGRAANITREECVQFSDIYAEQPDLPLIQIKAKIKPPKIAYLFDIFVCSEIKQNKDKSITAIFSAPDTDWLIGMLLGFEADIKIISPKRIAESIQKKAKEISGLYK
ncbi:MAG: YafY family transcriptional regulator [Treponema sp.]|nr:YafY family transcriptional regulator [Treponema sp.]MBR5645142.1 YafY family transcriptional regulator [Treponema sp.]